MSEMRKIYLERTEKAPLARYFNCTIQHVNNALRGDKDSPLVMRIRMEALKRGGFYIPARKKIYGWHDTTKTNAGT
jgi:hypothetical protein